MTLPLTIRCAPNPRLEPLIDGTVKVEGVELKFELEIVDTIFYKNLHFDDFDVSEMSLSESLIARERRDHLGNGRWNWTAVPVYLSRAHAWVTTEYNTRSGIKSMADLRGKKVAVPDYDMTAAVWWRALLKDLYDIDAGEIEWFNMRTAGLSHGVELGLNEEPLPGITLHWLPSYDLGPQMLNGGEIDAAYRAFQLGGAPTADVQPLLDDGGKGLVSTYYRKTCAFQPNHHYVIQDRIVQENPWLPMTLYAAFEESKRISYERSGRSGPAYMYFPGDPDEQAAVFGDDPYPFGLKAMTPTLERLERALHEQGLVRGDVKFRDLYHPSTLQT